MVERSHPHIRTVRHLNARLMKAFITALVLTSIFISCSHRDGDNRFDTNAAEAAETPGDKVRGNSDTNEEAERKAKPLNEKPVDTSTFVKKASEASLMEIALGQIAARKATSKKVVEFGERMVKDHSAANDELKALAARKGIHLSGDCIECEAKFNEFANNIMNEFDMRYVRMMIEDHEKAVKLFEQESTSGKDNEIRNWAKEKLPVLKHHLSMAQELNTEITKGDRGERDR